MIEETLKKLLLAKDKMFDDTSRENTSLEEN